MTPLVNRITTITPAQGLVGTMWGCVVVPELQSYFVPNGVSPQNLVVSGGIAVPAPPIAGPIYRAIKRLSTRSEGGGGITGGRLSLYELCLDGNWHLASAQTVNSGILAANTGNYQYFGPGTFINPSGNAWTGQSGVPFLGVGLVFAPGAGLAGGNINYLEVKAMVDAIDAGFVFGAQLGALTT